MHAHTHVSAQGKEGFAIDALQKMFWLSDLFITSKVSAWDYKGVLTNFLEV